MENAYALPSDQVLAKLGVDANNGLTDERVVELRLKYGKNGTDMRPLSMALLPESYAPAR